MKWYVIAAGFNGKSLKMINKNAIVQIHQVYEKWVSTVIYFTDCHETLVSDIVMGMQPFSALKDEFVYCQHEIAAHVYFLMKGKVQLTRTSPLTKKEIRLTSHNVGEHFGEVRFDFATTFQER